MLQSQSTNTSENVASTTTAEELKNVDLLMKSTASATRKVYCRWDNTVASTNKRKLTTDDEAFNSSTV